MPDERCETCRFWRELQHETDTEYGDCRRHPPVIVHDLAAIRLSDSRRTGDDDTCWDQHYAVARSDCTQFPATHFEQWCGEYQPAGAQT